MATQIAYVTSIGEQTTQLCKWSLERLGFQVFVLQSSTSLWEKLDRIFRANIKGDILRVDADVIVNSNVLELVQQADLWWYQSLCFGWFKQDIIHGGVQFIREECLPAIRAHIKEAEFKERPESYLSRLEEFHNPRVFGTFEKICGIHGFGQSKEDVKRAMDTKLRRGVYGDYDFELAVALEML